MGISVADFVAQRTGQLVKSPHGILGQCVSVPSEFAVLNEWNELYGAGDDTALHIWLNGIAGYQKIGNTPAGYPSTGDFVFFGAQYGGGAGHTGLVVSANTQSVTLFEQNDPLGSGAHEKTYSYQYLLGWFHHPSTPPQPAPNPGAGIYPVRRVVNVRSGPHVTAPVVGQLHVGTVQVIGVVTGDTGTVGGHTSNQWGQTLNHNYFNMAATQ